MNRDFTSNDYDLLLSLDDNINNKGATNTEIIKLPVHKIDKNQATNPENNGPTTNETCCICLCEMENGEEVRTLPCKHFFHVTCIDQWLKVNKVCPVDKKAIN
ncbi:hypothetical protein DICPUDRAFT_92417 [Dictyostelium purpureum]|uniref:RING-type E3 ubiquitin transferase n=1 Tax=Dictyostelium purpureum TaxID=5786 RepID=F0ZRJ6_DICPU|nr:uncharacterized protein DICPUDRAFT_92417 [Dictyostelium purpureum]EGC33431.1 hypothetical protein DICPUDRAFT_92417 [Dictyostelium purpureum]|eukprot:XP_003290050.1 hypothetical protein DICPUDRAFT_92417 [Dictyostelium purpureum]